MTTRCAFWSSLLVSYVRSKVFLIEKKKKRIENLYGLNLFSIPASPEGNGFFDEKSKKESTRNESSLLKIDNAQRVNYPLKLFLSILVQEEIGWH